MPKPGNPPPPWFWGSTKKLIIGFESKPGETVAISFEAKLEKTVSIYFEAKPVKTVAAGFEAKPPETVAAGFEAKPVKTVRVVLRPNHSQIVDLGFKAHSRNLRSSPPCARCRPHTAPPDLSIARQLNIRPVRHLRSSTPDLLLLP
jgi:hypothetical protein